jgi:hypothetical protein
MPEAKPKFINHGYARSIFRPSDFNFPKDPMEVIYEVILAKDPNLEGALTPRLIEKGLYEGN